MSDQDNIDEKLHKITTIVSKYRIDNGSSTNHINNLDDQINAEYEDQYENENNVFKKNDFSITRIKKTSKFLFKKFTTKEGIVGDYAYAHLFKPKIPFRDSIYKYILHKPIPADTFGEEQPFFPLDADIPILLGLVFGFQQALAMLAGLFSAPQLIASAANLDTKLVEYLVSASLICSGIFSFIQVSRFHLFGKYYLGSGLLSVVGTSFATVTVAQKLLPMMYANGECPSDAKGNPLPCPHGYGKLLGTSSICGLLEILISFIPPKLITKYVPPVVTGSVVLLIGLSLIESGFQDFMGGSGCIPDYGGICDSRYGRTAPWGSAQFFGLGALVFISIIVCEKWGPPIFKSMSVIVGLLIGSIVAAATGHFQPWGSQTISDAPAVTFLWVHTFPLKIYGPAVLSMLITFVILFTEALGDIGATCDVSRLAVSGPAFTSRVQGGVLSDAVAGIFGPLLTMTPMSTFAQNNGIIATSKAAANSIGYYCVFFLLVMGIFAKFASAIVAIPASVIGGMTTYLFTSVCVSGLKIISTIPFTRRDRFILNASLMFGFGAIVVPDYFSYVFTYSGSNRALAGFLDSIVLIMETSFAVSAVIGMLLNWMIPQELDEELVDDISIQQSNIEVLEAIDGIDRQQVYTVMSNKA
ncbi:hypothetical protein ACO0OL_001034 [Hanseniaspora opuntiae]